MTDRRGRQWSAAAFFRPGRQLREAGWSAGPEASLALGRFESVLLEHDLAELRESVPDTSVAAGTLLWQGPKLGFCILDQAANRHSPTRRPVPVLSQRSKKRDTNVAPDYLLPFRSLLKLAAQWAPERVTQSHVEALAGFADRLESTMGTSR